MAGNFNNVSMGNGVLKYDGIDVGFLKGDVTFTYNYNIERFKTGIPMMERGNIAKELVAQLKAPLAEISIDNLAMALGGLPLRTETVGSVTRTRIDFGTQFSLQQKSLEFIHTSPVTGKNTTVYMHKATTDGNVELNFAEGSFIVNNVTFDAVYDDSHPENPMGYLAVDA